MSSDPTPRSPALEAFTRAMAGRVAGFDDDQTRHEFLGGRDERQLLIDSIMGITNLQHRADCLAAIEAIPAAIVLVHSDHPCVVEIVEWVLEWNTAHPSMEIVLIGTPAGPPPPAALALTGLYTPPS